MAIIIDPLTGLRIDTKTGLPKSNIPVKPPKSRAKPGPRLTPGGGPKVQPLRGDNLEGKPLSKARQATLARNPAIGGKPIQAKPVSQARLKTLGTSAEQAKVATKALKAAPKAGTMSAAGGTAKPVLGAGQGGVGAARPSKAPLPEGQSFKAVTGKARTVIKESLAREAARQPGTNATERARARINLQKQQTAKLNKLGRLSRAAKKSRSPTSLAFAIGLDAIIEREIDIQNNPTGFQPGDIL